jgi:ketosteroid isomerase-like protein
MTAEDARAFAEEWAGAWNELAVERVLAHFHEDVVFTSPTAMLVVGVATVRGKQALREYWNAALARGGPLRFVVDRVLWDANTRELAIIYEAHTRDRRRRVSENLTLDADGLVMRGEVFHGVDV